MKFPSVKKTSYQKSECSPLAPKDFKAGILLNIPAEIIWGEALPVCGYFKDDLENYPASSTNSTFGFILQPQDKIKMQDNYENRELGNPEIKMEGDVFKNFKKKGDLYFQVDGQHIYRPLPPGEYLVSLNFRDFNSLPKRLKVVAGGWMETFSDVMVQEICQGQLLEDVKNYLDMNFKLELVDLNPNSRNDYQIKMDLLWKKGFAKHKEKIESVLPKPKKTQDQAFNPLSDSSIAFYITQQVKKSCPTKDLHPSAVNYILRGIGPH